MQSLFEPGASGPGLSSSDTKTDDAVTAFHASYDQRAISVREMSDAYEGEHAIKSAGQVYLPRPPAQTDQEYNSYVARADYPEVLEPLILSLIHI